MENKELVYVGVVDAIRIEDGGQAKIATIYSDDDHESGVFFRFQSWQENGNEKDHEVFDSLMKEGRKVQITLKVLD